MDDMIDRARVALLLTLVLGVATVVLVSLFVECLAVINSDPRDTLIWWFPIAGGLFVLVPGQVDVVGQRLRFETDLVTIERQPAALIASTIAPDQSSLWIRNRCSGTRLIVGPGVLS